MSNFKKVIENCLSTSNFLVITFYDKNNLGDTSIKVKKGKKFIEKSVQLSKVPK